MERSGNFYKAIQLGYILISILIGCMAYNSLYEWQEIEALELGNKKIDELRKEINNINIQMIKFSLLGETILEWNDKDIEHYHARRMAMDSMLCRFKATYPAERIDSVRSLLEDKERQMFQIVRLMDEQQSINKKIANQIPVIVQKSVQEQSKKPKRKEDNIVYCEFVCNMLAREGYRTVKAYHLSTAKKHLQQATDNDIVVADLRLPDGNGIDLLRWMRKEGKMQPFIIMTDYAEVNTAVESMKLGSIDYIPKQLVEDKLVPLIRSILKERQAGQRRMPVFARDGSAFQKIMHRIRLVAATDMSVMIFGENGTGKEHIAHHLHDKSKRAVKPFVAVDCGSLTKELAPSAFFGHVKGAFTGADCAKKGYFHEAEGGTLFLDEVGNLALETQQMLLRAIQERRYRPVGDKADRSFNVRIIAATNEDLEAAVSEKRFRQDLLYRLHDFGITVPPLRDCQEDIMPLAEFFREAANKELECDVIGFDGEARKTLLTHVWPGNVRELRQKIMGAVLQAQTGLVTKEHLELAVTKPTSPVSFALRNDAEDKERILRALKQANGNRKVAAELLGIGRTTLYSKLEEYGLKYKFRQS